MSLIREKVAQAAALMRELDLPCWLTFVRETGILPEPVMPFLAPGRHLAQRRFLVPPNGQAVAIVGLYDRRPSRKPVLTRGWKVTSRAQGAAARRAARLDPPPSRSTTPKARFATG